MYNKFIDCGENIFPLINHLTNEIINVKALPAYQINSDKLRDIDQRLIHYLVEEGQKNNKKNNLAGAVHPRCSVDQ